MTSMNDKQVEQFTVDLKEEYCGYWDWYGHIPEKLKNNHKVILAAVKEDGYALEYTTNELKGNREIVLAAVEENAFALQYATDELKDNREIVLAAVKKHGTALKFASHNLKGDPEIVLAAIEKDFNALEYASNHDDDYTCTLAIIADSIKKNQQGAVMLHKWVADTNMKDRLHALVKKFDATVADVKDESGRRAAIDKAIPSCKKAMESALRLFEKYDVDFENPPLHKSRTACVLKAFF